MKPALIGSHVLDALPATRVALSGATLDALKALVANPESTAEQFLSLLPAEQLLAIVVASSGGDASQKMPSAIRGDIESLGVIISREIPEIRLHKGFALAVRSAADTLGKSKQEGNSGSWRTITGMGSLQMLVGERTPLTPALRILLKTSSSTDEFDFTADAADLAFLAKGFGEFLAEMFEQRVALVDKGVVEVLQKTDIVERIGQLERAIQRIKQLAPQFGIIFSNRGDMELSERSSKITPPDMNETDGKCE